MKPSWEDFSSMMCKAYSHNNIGVLQSELKGDT